jgi:hypothetical protein
MGLFKWTKGRQKGCHYEKFTLWYFRVLKFGFDSYILKYEPKQYLPTHTDPVENGKHYRMNIGFGKSIFECEQIILKFKITDYFTVNIFRPDLYRHNLLSQTKTFKLSFGFVKYN